MMIMQLDKEILGTNREPSLEEENEDYTTPICNENKDIANI